MKFQNWGGKIVNFQYFAQFENKKREKRPQFSLYIIKRGISITKKKNHVLCIYNFYPHFFCFRKNKKLKQVLKINEMEHKK
jgi:hypothetical protein